MTISEYRSMDGLYYHRSTKHSSNEKEAYVRWPREAQVRLQQIQQQQQDDLKRDYQDLLEKYTTLVAHSTDWQHRFEQFALEHSILEQSIRQAQQLAIGVQAVINK
jgi:hypothetical protein